jgi:glycosidase
MQWDASPTGGFTTGRPWLPVVDPAERNVADQGRDPGSLLSFYRAAIALRPELAGEARFVDAAPDVVAFERGEHVIAVNVAAEERPGPPAGELVLHTHGAEEARLGPHEGFVARKPSPG